MGNRFSSMNTLPNGGYLLMCSSVQSLCLDDNERQEAMSSCFANTANGDVVQSPGM